MPLQSINKLQQQFEQMQIKPKANRVREELRINEDQWQCINCTLVNEIHWDDRRDTRCIACEKPNTLVDEMIKEKWEIRRLDNMKAIEELCKGTESADSVSKKPSSWGMIANMFNCNNQM